MINFLNKINKKINCLTIHFAISGIVLLILGVLIIWTDFVLRVLVGIFIFVVSYICFYSAFRIWQFKNNFKKYFKK